MASPPFSLVRQVYSILKPFGRRRLVGIIVFNLVQALLQALSVIVIMAFASAIMGAQNGQTAVSSAVNRLDDYLSAFSGNPMVLWGTASLLVIVIANVWNLLGEYVRTHYAERTGYLLTTGILRTIAQRPYAFHLRNNSSLLLKKSHADVQVFVSGVLGPMLDFAARLFIVAFLFVSLLLANPVVALALCGVFLVLYFCFFLAARRFWVVFNQQVNRLDKITYKSVYQFLTGIKPIMVHGVSPRFLGTYEEAARKKVRYRSLSPVVANGPRYIVEIAVIGGGVAFMTWLMLQGANLEKIAPTAAAFLYGGYRMLPNIQLMFGSIGMIKSNSYTVGEILSDVGPADLHRAHETLIFPDVAALPFNSAIELENVGFRYSSSAALVLDNLSLVISKGEKVAFVGHTGSGKSTVVDMILGLHLPSSGRILVDGHPLNEECIPSWRCRIGYVPQDIFLIDDTVRRNIAFGLLDEEIDEEAIRESIRMAQAEEFIFESMPAGLETIVGERGVRMSGGQRQRIGLARALYHRPDVLVLDEATSALDNATEASIMTVIDTLSDELTIIMVAHRLSTVLRADRIFVLKNGVLKASGRYDELIETSPDFAELAESAK